ncbi:MAG: hypothetical protein GKR86_00100 [Ilumatobacter sp.]|nr:hypothetical protein [Ilumatobacter sp.]
MAQGGMPGGGAAATSVVAPGGANPAATTSQGGTAYDQSADLFGKASGGLDRFQGGLLGNINDYINPYYENVVNDTLGRMRDERTRSLGAVGDAATNAGAFGGSRHGLLESDVYAQFDRNANEYANRAASDAYTAGIGAYGQDLQGQLGLSGMQGQLGQQLFGVGNTIQNQQAGWGQVQQDMMNRILGGGADMWNQGVNSPYQIIDVMNAILGGDPRRGAMSGQTSSTPGLFDYLSLGAQAIGGMG